VSDYIPLALASLLYTWQACVYAKNGDLGMAYAFWSYMHANLGFLYAMAQRATPQ
jgi:hypothetical protein